MEGRRAGEEFVVCAQVHYESALLGGFVYRKGGAAGCEVTRNTSPPAKSLARRMSENASG